MRFVVVYDACVLYPAPLRDFLIRLALTGLFAARWSDRIHDEWTSSLLAERPELASQIARTRSLMDEAVEDCLITGYEQFINALALPDPNDRHVLAAAICAGAQLIVTANLKDFPAETLNRFGMEAVHPDAFVEQQMDLHEDAVIRVAKLHHESLKNPPKSVEEYLNTLAAQGLVVTAKRLQKFRDLI